MRAKYMAQLTRQECSTIFKYRTRMLKVKNNYKAAHPNNICRMCKLKEETQDHVLSECPVIHINEDSKITKEEVFSEDYKKLQAIARNISNTIEKINVTNASAAPANRSSNPVTRASTQ